ncbi:MAG: ribulose-phosphate 3-epimerase [Dehalococcoidia bacterium]|nr:ribulose-phosphate 3-epimerase [Dehalococcoidia bacterium]
MPIKLAPSILSADFARLGEQAAAAERAGADYLHVDVMDGHFVPNLTIGPIVVKALRPHVKIPLDVHLMVTNPDAVAPEFAAAGADIITIHAEATHHLHRSVQAIKALGVKAGVSINPSTSLSAIEEMLPYLDLILVMTVNPGFGGQTFIQSVLPKIARLRRMLDDGGYPAELEVDGGVNAQTAPAVVQAGSRVLVAGSAIYNAKESVADAIARLRRSIIGVQV